MTTATAFFRSDAAADQERIVVELTATEVRTLRDAVHDYMIHWRGLYTDVLTGERDLSVEGTRLICQDAEEADRRFRDLMRFIR